MLVAILVVGKRAVIQVNSVAWQAFQRASLADDGQYLPHFARTQQIDALLLVSSRNWRRQVGFPKLLSLHRLTACDYRTLDGSVKRHILRRCWLRLA